MNITFQEFQKKQCKGGKGGWTREELKKICKSYGLLQRGSKETLCKRILNNFESSQKNLDNIVSINYTTSPINTSINTSPSNISPKLEVKLTKKRFIDLIRRSGLTVREIKELCLYFNNNKWIKENLKNNLINSENTENNSINSMESDNVHNEIMSRVKAFNKLNKSSKSENSMESDNVHNEIMSRVKAFNKLNKSSKSEYNSMESDNVDNEIKSEYNSMESDSTDDSTDYSTDDSTD